MRVEKDFEDLLGSFNRHKVRYCIIGAYAVGFYARPRYTKDIDILIDANPKNGKRIIDAIREFGFGSLALSSEDFATAGKVIQLGYEPVRIDIITSIKGLTFRDIWKGRKIGIYGNTRVSFIGLKELIRSKKAAGRKHDLVDLDILLSAKRRKTH